MNRISAQTTPLVLSRKDPRYGFRADMKTRYLALLILCALATGIGSGWALLGEQPPFGSVNVGQWQSFPRVGSSDVDPYGRAILARGPHLPLSTGEGLQLIAQTDSTGSALEGRCRYEISGSTLPSRGWTLTAADKGNRRLTSKDAASISDADLITDETGQILVTASASVAPGTWLRVPANEPFGLILRFYDTPSSASAAQLRSTALPQIRRVSCSMTG